QPSIISALSVHSHMYNSHLHSFPTRRSSDLDDPARLRRARSTVQRARLRKAIPSLAGWTRRRTRRLPCCNAPRESGILPKNVERSEEHTSELQSPYDLVCRLLLEKKQYCVTT